MTDRSAADGSVVRSDRTHHFDVDPPALWGALCRTEDYRRWWPWLHLLDGADFAAGATWRCAVKPPLPYVVRFQLRIDHVEPPLAASATITGDVRGRAELALQPDGHGGSTLRLVSDLEPDTTLLRGLAWLAHPVVRFGHDWVLDTGLRQFRDRALR